MPNPPKKNMLERVADVLDLPADIVARLPRIEITGCRRLYIENHQGLLEYEDTLIQISGGPIIISIRGADLHLDAMNARELLLGGLITSVEFGY